MAKEASVAPKERVNIVYRPALGDAREEIELPLKLLVMSDFTLRKDERAVEEREPINVDKDNFNEVMKEQEIRLDIQVRDRLSGEGEMKAGLHFETLKDFNPESIARNTPELKTLLELRTALTALKGPLSNVPEFRRKIQGLFENKDDDGYLKLLRELGMEEE